MCMCLHLYVCICVCGDLGKPVACLNIIIKDFARYPYVSGLNKSHVEIDFNYEVPCGEIISLKQTLTIHEKLKEFFETVILIVL